MSKFPLPKELSRLHDHAIEFASVVQMDVVKVGGCQDMASEALNALGHTAILTHRAARSLCEEGWTPVAPLLVRTLLDIFASYIAIVSERKDANFMGFKYLSHFYLRLLHEAGTASAEDKKISEQNLKHLIRNLPSSEHDRANTILQNPKVNPYWFQKEYASTRVLLEKASPAMYELYRDFSGITHGGFSSKLIFNDHTSEDIEPMDRPQATKHIVVASSRLLVEICYIRDHWVNHGANGDKYKAFVAEVAALR
jgi:hypothetical protein